MRRFLQFCCNIPWTMLGMALGLTCGLSRIEFKFNGWVIICRVKKIWFLETRYIGITLGHTIIILAGKNRKLEQNNIAHEYVHVEQYDRYWGTFPVLYCIEGFLNGYDENRFEIEAYRRVYFNQK